MSVSLPEEGRPLVCFWVTYPGPPLLELELALALAPRVDPDPKPPLLDVVLVLKPAIAVELDSTPVELGELSCVGQGVPVDTLFDGDPLTRIAPLPYGSPA